VTKRKPKMPKPVRAWAVTQFPDGKTEGLMVGWCCDSREVAREWRAQCDPCSRVIPVEIRPVRRARKVRRG